MTADRPATGPEPLMPLTSVAAQYGVARQTVQKIRKGQR